MTAELAYDPDDWKGVGEWDDMEVPKDRQERSYLKSLEAARAKRAALAQKRPPHEWPQAEVDLLVTMWKEGATAQKISTALGTRSRSAVMGRIDRMTRAGVLWRDDIHTLNNMADAERKRPKGRSAFRNNHLFGMTESRMRTRRLWKVQDHEPEAVVATVLMFRTEAVLDEAFDTVETGWGDPWAEFKMAA